MGDPVVTAGLGIGLSMETGAAILGGRQQRNAYKMEAAQMETEKKAIETNAAVAQEERLRQLKTVLATQNAAFAMGGQTAGVGSSAAIQAASISEANREQRLQNLQTDIAKKSVDYNIWSAKQASKHAMSTSMLNFAVNLGSRVTSSFMNAYAKKNQGGS